MTGRREQQDELVPVSLGVRRGPDLAILATLVIVVVLVGVFGRLVPKPIAVDEAGRSPAASGVAGTDGAAGAIRLVAPGAGVLMLRSTEVLVRGAANPGIRRVEATLLIGGRSMGPAVLDVDVSRRFSGLISITPPAHRTSATLQVREAGRPEVLAEVQFPIEAGALLLPKDPSALHGRAGRVLVIDVLVYARLGELRGLLTGVDGHLIATGSTVLSGPGAIRGGPRTVAVELEIPTEALPSRARLHLLGIDPAGIEVEHIDANVVLSAD